MYADDTPLVCESDNIDSVTKKTGLAFESMQKWCNANKLSINFTKIHGYKTHKGSKQTYTHCQEK